MAYTYVDLISSELNGLEIGTTTIPSINTVNIWIEDAESEIELRTGKVWGSTTATSTYLDYDGSGFLKLPYSPVISITSLQYESNGLGADSVALSTITEGSTEDFIKYVMDGEIEFIASVPKGYQNICISYTYGYANTPAYITRLATLLVAKRCINATINASAQGEGGSVTVGNISITDPSTFSVNYIRDMNNEIQDIYSRIGQTKVYRNTRVYDLR